MKLVKEIIDQSAHLALGYAMARSMRGLATPEKIVEGVMSWAATREALQHPDGFMGSGSARDMKYWRKGAVAGAGK